MDEKYRSGEIQNGQIYQNSLDKFRTIQRELPEKNLQEIAFCLRPKIEEHIIIDIDNSTHEEHLS